MNFSIELFHFSFELAMCHSVSSHPIQGHEKKNHAYTEPLKGCFGECSIYFPFVLDPQHSQVVRLGFEFFNRKGKNLQDQLYARIALPSARQIWIHIVLSNFVPVPASAPLSERKHFACNRNEIALAKGYHIAYYIVMYIVNVRHENLKIMAISWWKNNIFYFDAMARYDVYKVLLNNLLGVSFFFLGPMNVCTMYIASIWWYASALCTRWS